MRVISHSEASTALSCPAKHAFAYTGHLTGGTCLKPKITAHRLRSGNAWGIAVATYHEHGESKAFAALIDALDKDHAKIIDALDGAPDSAIAEMVAEHEETIAHLSSVLEHYISTAGRFHKFSSPERELRIPVPGMEDYGFEGYIDGLDVDHDGNVWIVEFKLRDKASNFTDPAILPLLRQPRWYALAAKLTFEVEPVGVILDERESAVPGPVKLNKPNKDGKQVPRKGQASCSLDEYLKASADAGVEPDEATVEKLGRREWHRRQEVIFLPGELEEAAQELTALAKLVGAYDKGKLHPVRAAGPLCRSCDYRSICPDPTDDYTDTVFRRVPAKRDRVNAERGGS